MEDKDPRPARVPTGEIWRKLIHVLVLVVPALLLLAGKTVSLWILVPLTVVAIASDYLRVRSAPFRQFIIQYFGYMMRPGEWNELGGKLVLNGATWILCSLTLLVLAFPFKLALASFAIFVAADAAAAIVGMPLGKHQWPGSRKSIEGTAAFLTAGLLMALLLFEYDPQSAVPAVTAGALTEALLRRVDDNLVVPLVIATVLHLL